MDAKVETLVAAAGNGNKAEVQRLIEEEKVPIDQPDAHGDTALHAAASQGREDIVKYLLSKGADPNARNKTGSTPLHKIVNSRYDPMGIINELLKAKADPTIKNAAGLLPEQLTSRQVIIKKLLGDSAVTEEVDVPKQKHGRVIGKAGQKMNEIRQEANALITVPKRDDPSSKIQVYGRPENVAAAKKLILAAVSDQQSEGGDDHGEAFTTVRFPVPKELHKRIIGVGGRTINEIRDETGVRITVPQPNDPDTNILLKGDTDDIDEAIKRIQQITFRPPSNGSPRVRGDGSFNNNNNRRPSDERRRDSGDGGERGRRGSGPDSYRGGRGGGEGGRGGRGGGGGGRGGGESSNRTGAASPASAEEK